MDLTHHVESLRGELLTAAEAGGDEALVLARRLVAPLESSARLAFLGVLSAAVDEITRDLAPGSVELRLRGLDPDFVVTLPPTEESFDGATAASQPDRQVEAPHAVDDGAVARINFRPPEQLKSRIEEAAQREGLSVNAWLVRAVSTVLQQGTRTQERRGVPQGGQHFAGWVQ